MPLNEDPTGNAHCNQDASGGSKQCPPSLNFADFSELSEITVAWTTRTEMIEPFFRFREWHCSRSDSLENIQPGALAALRIGKLREQPPAQHIQDALFICSRVSSRVQVRLSLSTTKGIYIQKASAGLLDRRGFQQPKNLCASLFQSVLELHLRLVLSDP